MKPSPAVAVGSASQTFGSDGARIPRPCPSPKGSDPLFGTPFQRRLAPLFLHSASSPPIVRVFLSLLGSVAGSRVQYSPPRFVGLSTRQRQQTAAARVTVESNDAIRVGLRCYNSA